MSVKIALQRLFPIAAILLLFGAFFAFGFDRYLSLDGLRRYDTTLHHFVDAQPLLAAAGYVASYAAVIALSLPTGAVMTLTGGFLFGLWGGALVSVVGATAGAFALFLIVRYAAADWFRERAGTFAGRMADGFGRNAFTYLLFLRLVPLFPFWAVNLVPALLGMRAPAYVAATFIGIIPGTLAYASIGDGLDLYFSAGKEVPLDRVFSPEMIGLRVGFALLALLPLAIRRLCGRGPH